MEFISRANANLEKKEIHIWRIDLAESNRLFAKAISHLSNDELTRASQYKFLKDKNKFILRRAAIRKILALYMNKGAKEIKFSYSEHGKPNIASQISDIEFNFSSSHDKAILAVNLFNPVGIDIEYVEDKKDLLEVAQKFFSIEEINLINFSPREKQLEIFYQIWTAKEAFIKALGVGLSYPLDQFFVELKNKKCMYVKQKRIDRTDSPKWYFYSFSASKHYVGAVSTEWENVSLNFFDFEWCSD